MENNEHDLPEKATIDKIHSRLGEIQTFIVFWAFFHTFFTEVGLVLLEWIFEVLDWIFEVLDKLIFWT